MKTLPYKLSATLLFAILVTVLLSGAGRCFGQNKIELDDFNLLTVERTKLKPGRLDSIKTEYIARTRIRIIKTDKSVIKGRISRITDSSVIVKDKEILIKDIKVIGRYFGPETAVTGASSLITGIGLILFYNWYNDNHHPNEYSYANDYKGALAGGIILSVAGIFTTIFGVAGLAANRHYEIGDKWRLAVKNSHKPAHNN